MEYTKIPSVELKASRIGLGTWSIGGSLWGGSDEKESIKTIRKAIDLGINLFDSAPAYGNGQAETILGKAIKEYGKRDQLIIATKFGLNFENPQDVFRDSRKSSIIKEVEQSLQRLQVDSIDLYQVHWPDHQTLLEETATTLKRLQEQGKIKAVGVSNFKIEQIQAFRNTVIVDAVQPPFNLFERQAEAIIQFCQKEDIAILSYSALARGLLSGKMSKGREFNQDDLRKNMDPKFKEPRFSQYLAAVKGLDEWVRKKYKKPIIALAVRWILDKGVNIALWGARKQEQLIDIDAMLGWELTQEDFKEIDGIINQFVKDPVGPEFMSPPERKSSGVSG